MYIFYVFYVFCILHSFGWNFLSLDVLSYTFDLEMFDARINCHIECTINDFVNGALLFERLSDYVITWERDRDTKISSAIAQLWNWFKMRVINVNVTCFRAFLDWCSYLNIHQCIFNFFVKKNPEIAQFVMQG